MNLITLAMLETKKTVKIEQTTNESFNGKLYYIIEESNILKSLLR